MGSVSKEKISPNVNMGILLSLEQKATEQWRAWGTGKQRHKDMLVTKA
jgi:hypothetical protein